VPRRAAADNAPHALEDAMVLIQLLLPTSGAASADGLAPLAETRRELADRFNGLTAYLRSPAKGSWTAPDGHTEQDNVVMVEIGEVTFELTRYDLGGKVTDRDVEVAKRISSVYRARS
jgi:hypothetical protein